jgi:3-oxoadipyl-CoA thiolase
MTAAQACEEVVIIDAVRTPIGRYGGILKDVRPDDLGALVIRELIKRNPAVPVYDIEDVLLGCANQAGEDNRNVARMAVLLAKLPLTVGGGTVNRLCGSGLMAVNDAVNSIRSGLGDIYIAGGVESMTRAPFVMAKAQSAFARDPQIYDTTLGWRFTNKQLAELHYPFSMGETAENVAEKYGIKREDQDVFAVSSQEKYKKALDSGVLAKEIVAVPVPDPKKKGEVTLVTLDEHPRPDTTLASLAKLKPAFREGGTVTAGNSSGINDGASALLIMSKKRADALGLKPMARFLSSAVTGVDPAIMGIGPVLATQKALKRSGLKVSDLDLLELNEAFAAQVLACARDLELDMSKVNVNGGSIALGHPLGASGARILTTLVYEMQRRQSKYGLATMCIGVGQGIATIIGSE